MVVCITFYLYGFYLPDNSMKTLYYVNTNSIPTLYKIYGNPMHHIFISSSTHLLPIFYLYSTLRFL